MQTADFDVNAFKQSQQSQEDEKLLVKFFRKAVEDKIESAKQGRPIFKERDYIDIKVPGSKNSGACRPATAQDKQRFARHWNLFEQRMEAPEQGTPLAQWPLITEMKRREFEYLNVKTVEQLAELSDSNLQNFHGGRDLKNKAVAYLEHAENTKAVEEKLALEKSLEEKDEKIATLETQMSELMAKFETLDEQQEAIKKAATPKRKATTKAK